MIHGGGCPDISFDAAASRSVGVRVEPKVCEGCKRQFFRPVPVIAKVTVNGVTIQGGEKYCRACRARKKPAAGVQ